MALYPETYLRFKGVVIVVVGGLGSLRRLLARSVSCWFELGATGSALLVFDTSFVCGMRLRGSDVVCLSFSCGDGWRFGSDGRTWRRTVLVARTGPRFFFLATFALEDPRRELPLRSKTPGLGLGRANSATAAAALVLWDVRLHAQGTANRLKANRPSECKQRETREERGRTAAVGAVVPQCWSCTLPVGSRPGGSYM